MRQRKTGEASPAITGRRRYPFLLLSDRAIRQMEVSSAVKSVIATLEAGDEDLHINVANDTSESILDSLMDVAVTMVLAVIISMIVIFLFSEIIKRH